MKIYKIGNTNKYNWHFRYRRKDQQVKELKEILDLIFKEYDIITCKQDYGESDEDCQYFLSLNSCECIICKKYYDYRKKYNGI